MSEQATTQVKTGTVRFSYTNVWEPRTEVVIKDGKEITESKYSSAILIPKSDKATVALIEAATEAAKQIGKSKKWGGTIPGILKTPLRDGDLEKPEDEVYKGHYFLNASNVKKPVILGKDNEVLYDKDEFYSGVYGRAILTFFPFKSKSNGVAVALEVCKKTHDGEPLSGGISVEGAKNAFGDEGDDLM